MQLLGGQFHFETDSPRLLRIVQLAYARLPSHTLSIAAPRFLVRLLLTSTERPRPAIQIEGEPPRVGPLAGGGILCGAMDSANFVALTPQQRSALVVVSQDMLRFPYHIRYELLEFAVYVLAARVQGLVPLHAACVGSDGQGILLLGPSGSGKSTVALHCLLQGLDFLAEDSVLVRPDGLLATGVANFLHVRPDSLRFLADADGAAFVRKSSVIRRRSGVEKFEIDLRRPQYRLAPAPLRIGSVVFISPAGAGGRPLLVPLRKAAMIEQLAASQRYAANQPGWSTFRKQASRLPAFELRRGRHPLEAVEALRELLAASRPTAPAC
jgi:energy-coupling factor transporter ATP-binding protein EcfA2